MKLTTVASVRAAVGVPQLSSIDGAIEQALHRVTDEIAGAMRTKTFARGTYSDLFYLHRGRVAELGPTLVLANGFVDLNATVTIVYAGAFSAFDAGHAEALTTQNYFITPDKSLLVIRDRNLGGRYVQASYTSGFDVDGDDAYLYDQTQVPEWLKSAAIAKAHLLLMNNPLLNFEGTTKPEKEDLQEVYREALQPNIRYAPLGVYAIQSV